MILGMENENDPQIELACLCVLTEKEKLGLRTSGCSSIQRGEKQREQVGQTLPWLSDQMSLVDTAVGYLGSFTYSTRTFCVSIVNKLAKWLAATVAEVSQ